MFKRIQLIKMREGTPEAKVQELEKALRRMPHETQIVESWSIGRNINPMYPGQPLYTLIWQTEHESIRRLQLFNTHPYHRNVVWPYLNPEDSRCIVEEQLTIVYQWQ